MSLRTAVDIWDSLISSGRLAPKSHDKEFVAGLRKSLGISASQDTRAFLATHAIDTSSFLIAVLNALQPFSMMLNDIYEMFIDGGVSETNDRLLLEFDFGRNGELSFDANAFRTARSKLVQLNRTVEKRAYNLQDLQNIHNGLLALLRNALGTDAQAAFSAPIANAKALEWINGTQWPYQTPVPVPPVSPGDPLDNALAPLTSVVKQLCQRTGRYNSQDDLRKACPRPVLSTSDRAPIDEWSEPLLASVQQDHIARFHLLRTLWFYQQHAPRSNRSLLATKVETLIDAHSQVMTAQPLSRELDDLLDLPIWKHRSQLYCVWLVTLLRRELIQTGGHFQLAGQNGSLKFAFSKTPVASVQVNGETLELVAELREAAGDVELVSEKRFKNIQPDYSLLQRGNHEACRVIYVLEAKQYAKANTRNFNEALYDYANVHKHALVALANYGPIPSSQPQKLNELCKSKNVVNVSERCTAFANVHPSNTVSMRDVREHFRRALDGYELPRLIVDTSDSMSTVLNSGALSAWPTVVAHIVDSGMELILDVLAPQHIRAGEPARDAMLSMPEVSKFGPALRIYDIIKDTQGPLMLFTDTSGFNEVSSYHDNLAGIITLQPDGSLVIQFNAGMETRLRRTIPSLIAYAHVGASY